MNINIINSVFEFKKVINYTVIGLLATAIHVLVASGVIWMFNGTMIYSNVVGFAFAFSFSYYFQSRNVFKSEISINKMFKYLIVQLFALFCSLTITTLFHGTNPYLQVVVVAGLLPLFTYIVHSLWTFASCDA